MVMCSESNPCTIFDRQLMSIRGVGHTFTLGSRIAGLRLGVRLGAKAKQRSLCCDCSYGISPRMPPKRGPRPHKAFNTQCRCTACLAGDAACLWKESKVSDPGSRNTRRLCDEIFAVFFERCATKAANGGRPACMHVPYAGCQGPCSMASCRLGL